MAAFMKMANALKKASTANSVILSPTSSDDKKSSLSAKLNDMMKKNKGGLMDKLKNRNKRDGTPEKSGTPSQDTLQDEQETSRKNVIWGEDIEKLQIKDEELQKVREPRPPESDRRSPLTERLTVRKLKPASEINKPKPKVVTVAKPANPDAEVKPLQVSGFAGPRYDNNGHVICHSILGSYEEFQQQAMLKGDLLDIEAVSKAEPQPLVPSLKYEKKKKVRIQTQPPVDNESNALRNWQAKMMERKRQQGYISKLVQKNPEDLVMNASDNFRQIQEDRYIIDRTIPAVDYGKGYRVGSEFWKQQEKFGDDLTGVQKPDWVPSYGQSRSMTLTQTEKGYPPPIEHVGIPAAIRKEKGWSWVPTHTRPMHYPWHKSDYLEKRKKELMKYEEELDPHKPDFDGLEVIGSSNPFPRESVERRSDSSDIMLTEMERHAVPELEMFDDGDQENSGELRTNSQSNPTPIFGPSIQFAGQAARWTGDSYGFKDQVGIEARVNFETSAGERVTSYLCIINNGTTSIYYDWKKCPRENPFDLNQSNVQRFYFNNSSGVILPGETMKFPFVFKSPNAGVFHEQWQFQTRPVVCGGAALLVTLRGIALQEDKYKRQRQQLEAELKQKEAEQMVRHVLEEIVGGMRTPERPSSPIDAYITEEEIFRRNNPLLHYHHDAIQELKQLHLELVPEEDRGGRLWDLCVDDLKDELLDLDDDNEHKESYLHQLNTAVSKMSFTPQSPIRKQLYKAGYQLLLEAVDEMVYQSAIVRQVMGLPEKDMDEFVEETTTVNAATSRSQSAKSLENKLDSRASRRMSRTPSKTPNPKLSSEDSNLTAPSLPEQTTNGNSESGKGKKGAPDKGAKQPPPDKKAAAPPAKEKDKGGKLSKESTKADLKSGKSSATPGPAKPPPSRGKTSGSLGDRERTGSPTSMMRGSQTHEDPVIDQKYKDKLYTQTYYILGDTIDRMENVFQSISERRLPALL